jgi:hypothetical protein
MLLGEKTMVVSMEDVISALSATELRYKRAAKLGVEALPHLEIIVKIAMPLLAARAAFMAGLIQNEKSVDVLMLAAQRNTIQVRLAAAYAIRNLRIPSVEKVSDLLKRDVDAKVRRQALRSIEARNKERSST